MQKYVHKGPSTRLGLDWGLLGFRCSRLLLNHLNVAILSMLSKLSASLSGQSEVCSWRREGAAKKWMLLASTT